VRESDPEVLEHLYAFHELEVTHSGSGLHEDAAVPERVG